MERSPVTGDELFAGVVAVLEAGTERGVDPDDNHRSLSIALDHLAYLVQRAEPKFDDEDYPEPPDDDYSALRSLVAQRFPDLGYYNVASEVTTSVGAGVSVVGDAVDDLADIYRDLRAASWRYHNTSSDDAVWDLQNTYLYHWGQHARCLQLYLHQLRLGQ